MCATKFVKLQKIDLITTIKNKSMQRQSFTEKKTLQSFFQLDFATSSFGDKDNVPWHKSDLQSCFAIRWLIKDQIQEASNLGVTVMQISVHNASDGCCQLVFSSHSRYTPFQLPPTEIIFSGWTTRLIRSTTQKW